MSRPPGVDEVPIAYWEHLESAYRDGPPLNGHRGYFAYHNEDCRCAEGGYPCSRDGRIWSCCGQTDRYGPCLAV